MNPGKVSGLSWSTVRSIIYLRDEIGRRADRPAGLQGHLRTLASSTAQQVLRFHRMQQSAPAA